MIPHDSERYRGHHISSVTRMEISGADLVPVTWYLVHEHSWVVDYVCRAGGIHITQRSARREIDACVQSRVLA